MKRFSFSHAAKEISKLRGLEPEEQPDALIFVVTQPVSAETRRRAREAWGNHKTCDFWCGAELDERVKRYPELVHEFFALSGSHLQPSYPDAQTQELAQALDAEYSVKATCEAAARDTRAVVERIINLKRQLREGSRLRAGDFLTEGRFKLLKPIGEGGFARVWSAYDRKSRAVVAVKVLHGQYAEDRTRRERLFRGAHQMGRLNHPGIVRVIEEVCSDGGYHFFVMEYLGGGDLREAIVSGFMTTDAALRTILRVGEALHFAHQHEVVHRDVKPANILLDLHGRPKLTDFDLVLARDTTGGTRTGMMGTVIYTAPEVMSRPQDASFQADVYGFGMTVAFLLYGADLPMAALLDQVHFIKNLDAPWNLKVQILRAITREPKRRHESVLELCQELSRALPVLAQNASARVDDKANERIERAVTAQPSTARVSAPERQLVGPRSTPPRPSSKSQMQRGRRLVRFISSAFVPLAWLAAILIASGYIALVLVDQTTPLAHLLILSSTMIMVACLLALLNIDLTALLGLVCTVHTLIVVACLTVLREMDGSQALSVSSALAALALGLLAIFYRKEKSNQQRHARNALVTMVVVFVTFGVIGHSLAAALEIAKVKRTVADVRNIGMAYLLCLTEEDRSEVCLGGLPEHDAWGTRIQYFLPPNAAPSVFGGLTIHSAGQDGIFEENWMQSDDIVWGKGYFLHLPDPRSP